MSLKVFIVVGEPSGDYLAARLVRAMRTQIGDVELTGVGGPELAAEGLTSTFPMDELTLMGFIEVVPHVPKLLRRLKETADAVRSAQADILITVDSPGFTLRLLKRVADVDIPKVHYVAPQAWAWRPDRAKKLPSLAHRYLAILPFEPAFFKGYGVDARFVGHPIAAAMPASARVPMGRGPRPVPQLCLLPGSRAGEIRYHMPVLRGAVERIVARLPEATCVLPTLPRRRALIDELSGGWPAPLTVVETVAERYQAYGSSDVALAASGTVGLELALARLPSVVFYRGNRLSAEIARRVIRVRFVSLINLIADDAVVSERLQEHCTASNVADDALSLLTDGDAWKAQQVRLDQVAETLAVEGADPSDRAAAEVLDLWRQWPSVAPLGSAALR